MINKDISNKKQKLFQKIDRFIFELRLPQV